jgi:hypothetical protein
LQWGDADRFEVYLNEDAAAAFRLLWQSSEARGRIFAHLYNSSVPGGWFKVALYGSFSSGTPIGSGPASMQYWLSTKQGS